VITNKRVIFGGYKRSVTIPISKISYVLPHKKDSILIGKESKQKPYYFSDLNKEKLEVSIANKTFSYPITSEIITALVQGISKLTSSR
jgi:hypothetical protein